MYQSYKVILGILHVWEEAGVEVSVSMVLRKKRRCGLYLSTKLEEAQLHCYLESCACVAAATTTACAIRQHEDHLRLVSAHISGGVHSSSLGGTKIFQVCNSVYLALQNLVILTPDVTIS